MGASILVECSSRIHICHLYVPLAFAFQGTNVQLEMALGITSLTPDGIFRILFTSNTAIASFSITIVDSVFGKPAPLAAVVPGGGRADDPIAGMALQVNSDLGVVLGYPNGGLMISPALDESESLVALQIGLSTLLLSSGASLCIVDASAKSAGWDPVHVSIPEVSERTSKES